MSNTYPRTTNKNKKPVYVFSVSKARSTRDLKVTFSHNSTNPIFLVNEKGEPQLGWRVDFQGRGDYDFDALPKTLQPLVRESVNEIFDLELARTMPRVFEHNSVTMSAYETVCNTVPGVYEVEEVFAILGRSHALEFNNPLSSEALNVAHRSLKNFTDIETLEDARENAVGQQNTIADLKGNLKELSSKWKEYMVPAQELGEGVDKLIRDIEAGWISYDHGDTFKHKVLGRLAELDDMLSNVWDYEPEEFD
ncbi:hypothetical protein ACTXJX_17420 [Glutamicibacter ardleyensis]|uniref:hypothetical protein n=1 Tax=Glutamicibacter ardleyensis TaxID=225894 RepID=UPI003FD4EA33